jgi:tetratricopeptide (TPR) repeat protein
MEDGSKPTKPEFHDSTYLAFRFTKKGDSISVCKNFIAIEKQKKTNCMSAVLHDSILKISNLAHYQLDYVSRDTLVFTFKVDGWSTAETPQFFMVNERVLIEKNRLKYKDSKKVIANPFYSPKLDLQPLYKDIRHSLYSYQGGFDCIGKLWINTHTKKVSCDLIDATISDSTTLRRFKKCLEKSYQYWEWEYMSDYDEIQIPFIYQHLKHPSYNLIYHQFLFFETTYAGIEKVKFVSFKSKQKSDYAFKKGIDAYKLKDFVNAISYFQEAYDENETNVEPLYNVAAIYLEMGKNEKACEVWQQLIDLGQVEAEKLHQDYCPKK